MILFYDFRNNRNWRPYTSISSLLSKIAAFCSVSLLCWRVLIYLAFSLSHSRCHSTGSSRSGKYELVARMLLILACQTELSLAGSSGKLYEFDCIWLLAPFSHDDLPDYPQAISIAITSPTTTTTTMTTKSHGLMKKRERKKTKYIIRDFS